MDPSILKVVGQIAGIGGIALGVLLIIFRNIIRKNIFPQLKPAEAYKIIRLIIILTFVIALSGIIAWVYTSTRPVPPTIKTSLPSTEDENTHDALMVSDTNEPLEITSFDYKKNERILDLIVRNKSPQTTIITSVALYLRYEERNPIDEMRGRANEILLPSGNHEALYDNADVLKAKISGSALVLDKIYSVSYSIEPRGADRYTFKFDLNENNLNFPGSFGGTYYLQVVITYNKQVYAAKELVVASSLSEKLSNEQNMVKK